MIKTECPNPQMLRQYVLGDCSDEVSSDLERHLMDCAACEASISEFDSVDDTLLRHLPLAAAATPDSSPQPSGWIDRLRREMPAGPHGNATQGPAGKESPVGQSDAVSPLTDGFANYEILGELGRGGMGVVFLARHKQLHRRVALKVVRPEGLSSLVARRRFQREIQILGGLHHPGIVMATDAGTVGRGAYLVMEWINGVDFGRLVRTGGPLTIETACETGRQIAEALAAAHKTGVVHRDVKPSNTMVDTTGRVRLLDFGLAHMTRVVQDSGDTSVGRLLGTLDYMAPEQAAGEGLLDARADLYGLGAMLFFLLTGQPPHGTRTNRSILEHIRVISQEESPRVRTIRVDVPPELDQLIARLLSRDPARRPESAAEIVTLLGGWAGGDLAARVIECQTQLPIPAEPADSAAARQSLADVLGSDVLLPRLTQGEVAPAASPRFLRGWWTLLALLATMGFPAVILWVQTSNGTLKIESEVGNVSVEVVDARDRVRELAIKGGQNETVLHTGQYRIRFASEHDGLELDRDVIMLRRGEQVVARIARRAMEQPVGAQSEKSPAAEPPTPERLYQGRSESEWKRQFQLETEPVAKLNAANALLALGMMLPSTEQLERILDVGEEIVQASSNDPFVEIAFQPGVSMLYPGPGHLSGSELQKSVERFRNSLNSLFSKTSVLDRAKGVSRAMVEGSDARAAFASALLRLSLPSGRIQDDPVAAQTVLTMLDVPQTGLDRSALCHLIRMRFISSIKDEAEASGSSVSAAWCAIAQWAAAVPAHDSQKRALRDLIRTDLLSMAKSVYRLAPAPRFPGTAARLVLSEVTERNGSISVRFNRNSHFPIAPGNLGADGMMFGSQPVLASAYDQVRITVTRQDLDFFLDDWIQAANSYLEENRERSTSQEVRNVILSLDAALTLLSDGDRWPVETTANLLAELLPAYEADGQDAITKQISKTLKPVTPAMLLTQIVRITGRLPDNHHGANSRSGSTLKNLQKLEILLKKKDESSGEDFHELAKHLITTAPYDVVRLISETEWPDEELGRTFDFRGRHWPMTAVGIVSALIQSCGDPSFLPPSFCPIDPLLMLVILADLTGQSARQDAGIAAMLRYDNHDHTYRSMLKDLLHGSSPVQKAALASLQKMEKSSKDDGLTTMVRALIAETAQPSIQK